MEREDNVFLVKRNIVDFLWKSANIEVAVTYPDTFEIFEGRTVPDVNVNDTIIINNLKRAWFFILNTLDEEITIHYLCKLNKIIGEATEYPDKYGHFRLHDVKISGTEYMPEMPIDSEIKDQINEIISQNCSGTEKALELMTYLMRKQIFADGNKRTALLIANKMLIQSGEGALAISVNKKRDFIKEIINYYETNDNLKLKKFLYDNCLEGVNELE